MSTTIAEVEVESISVDQPTCGRPCCRPRYLVRVLGKDVEVCKEDFDKISKKMRENDRVDYLDHYIHLYPRYASIRVKLVIE